VKDNKSAISFGEKIMRGSNAGLAADGGKFIVNKMTYHSVVLEIIDTFYSSLVIAPLVVSYWRGTWNLSHKYLFQENELHSQIASLIIGIVGHLVFTIGQGSLRNHFNPNRHRLTFYIGSRVYTSIYGIICVNCWRGGWQLIDRYTERHMSHILTITITAIISLMLLKAIRNVTATPFVVVTDSSGEYFDVPTMFKKSVRN
jgi:hypothetical protein